MDLSIIIVEFYCLDKLATCVESIIRNITQGTFEMIISSNSKYKNDQEELLKEEFPQCKWKFNRTNLGYAKAVNRGIRESSGEFLLILNPDTLLLDNTLEQAVTYMRDHKNIGILGPKIVNNDNTEQESYRTFMSPRIFLQRIFTAFITGTHKHYITKHDINKIQFVDWVPGACMLTTREAVEKVGMMDERYFLYMEDMDWCKRFWGKGYQVIYWPTMIIQHVATRKSSTAIAKKTFDKSILIHVISYIKFICKHFPYLTSREKLHAHRK